MTTPSTKSAQSTESPRARIGRLVRCPDCGSNAIALDDATQATEWLRGELQCTGCGRVLRLDDGVLHALPREVDEAARRNLEHYGVMADDASGGHLARRGETRNHHAKLALLTQCLGLDAGRDAGSQAVLEFGTGAGAHGAAFAGAGHAYAGMDIVGKYLHQARQRYPELRDALLVESDIHHAPFQPASFDAVFGVAVLHHLPEPLDGVNTLLDLLKPGGRFCFLEPRRFYPQHFVGYLRNPSVEIGTLKTYPRRIAQHLQAAGAAEVHTTACVYTPNRPKALVPLYERIDRVCHGIAPLRRLSVMFAVYGRKQGAR